MVLATGMQPELSGKHINGAIDYDEAGFIMPSLSDTGIFAVGCAKAPVDVTPATRGYVEEKMGRITRHRIS